ncbi:MAG: ferritin-like domain-containing protein [Chloroflexota bacterium]
MSNKRTLKALEELVKTEYMAVAALDSALEEVDDNKLRKQYKKWRDSHMKQAEALNSRLEDLGGEPVEYEVGTGKGQASLWGKLTAMRDDSSIAGMKIGAERGLKRYIDHLDEVEDPKALNIIRKNLEAKQDEMAWYDEQVGKERSVKLENKVESSRDKALEVEDAEDKKKGGLPFPLLVAAGAIGAAAFFLLRRSDDSDYDDYSEDAFRYETDEATTAASGASDISL